MSESKTQSDDRPTSDPRAAASDAAMEESLEEAAAQSVAQDLDQLQQQLDESRERLLRLQAELENYRKRARRELEDERRYANLPLLRDLLPVLDNMQRAIDRRRKVARSRRPAGRLQDGRPAAGERAGAARVPEDRRPAPAVRSALSRGDFAAAQRRASRPIPCSMVVQDGYQLHDRVVRPAQVIVSTAPPSAAGA